MCAMDYYHLLAFWQQDEGKRYPGHRHLVVAFLDTCQEHTSIHDIDDI